MINTLYQRIGGYTRKEKAPPLNGTFPSNIENFSDLANSLLMESRVIKNLGKPYD